MDPKLTIKEAAELLGVSARKLHKRLLDSELNYNKLNGTVYFAYPTARQLFQLHPTPKVISFQIIKGGTGKTSLACSVAVRANLLGLRVLCIDLDQQGNLTSSFGVDAESLPVMVDILADGYSYEDAITRVFPGLDLLASRIENSLLDEVLKVKRANLAQIYRAPLNVLKEKYDLIVIDCPPNIGQSVAAVTLAVDQVIIPVIPDSYALSGLEATCNAIKELQTSYQQKISFGIVFNKFETRSALALEAQQIFKAHAEYRTHLFKTFVHTDLDFPTAVARNASIFDSVKGCRAKRDIDQLTREILGISNTATEEQKEFASAEESCI